MDDFFDFFETVRRQNIDALTCHPLERLAEDELARLADKMSLTVAQLKAQQFERSVLLTCPLCGQPSTHLVGCKGCGGGCWGFEFVESFGVEARSRLKQKLSEVVKNIAPADAIEHAAKNAYNFGGCMVCPTCFHHTLPTSAFQTCPLYLLYEFALTGISASLLIALHNQRTDEETQQASVKWIANVARHWCEAWNTAVDTTEREKIARWRVTILQGALDGA